MPELPPPGPDALALSARLEARIREAIAADDGRIGFDAYMQMALYEPGVGYYVNGLRKFGPGGDFTTAPERSPLFARALARQVAQVLHAMPDGEVLEFGPGSGALAAELLAELDALGCAPARYALLELSADLKQRQREAIAARVPHLVERVTWLTQLPDAFRGVAIANEVLDAMPVRRFCVVDGGLAEQYVAAGADGLELVQGAPRDEQLAARVADLDLPAGYASEINPTAEAWVRSVCERLRAGLLLLIDYGYPRAEYYHPQRATGTLRCHYRQQAHDDALRWPGLQDITAHVDFTAIAEAAHAAGATVAGFTTQAQFLINCGLPGLLEAVDPASPDYLDLALQARQLLLPQAMGEAFKVLGLMRGLGDLAQLGFTQGDRRHRL